MFVYRDKDGKITDVTGSIDVAELERLKEEYGEADPDGEPGETTVEPDVGPDEDTVKAFEEANAPEPEPEPESQPEVEGESEPEPESQPEVEDETPKQSDTKATWVDFAVSQGADRNGAEDMTKQELIEMYGG